AVQQAEDWANQASTSAQEAQTDAMNAEAAAMGATPPMSLQGTLMQLQQEADDADKAVNDVKVKMDAQMAHDDAHTDADMANTAFMMADAGPAYPDDPQADQLHQAAVNSVQAAQTASESAG